MWDNRFGVCSRWLGLVRRALLPAKKGAVRAKEEFAAITQGENRAPAWGGNAPLIYYFFSGLGSGTDFFSCPGWAPISLAQCPAMTSFHHLFISRR
jgi:hypothetical protein